jgi:sodium-dependent dicarboxylate transporter 2/3/5
MVFGTGRIKISEMIRAGFWLNIIAIVIIVVGVTLLSGNILPT